MKHKPMPEHNYLKSILDYNPDTGVFIQKIIRKGVSKAGVIAGKPFGNGYWGISVNNTIYYANRLAWFYVTGEDPQNSQIDHINNNRLDNRFVNLRKANQSQNNENTHVRKDNVSGFKGVHFDPRDGFYYPRLWINGKHKSLGRYKTAFYAALVYARAARKIRGEFYKI